MRENVLFQMFGLQHKTWTTAIAAVVGLISTVYFDVESEHLIAFNHSGNIR